MSTNQMHGEVEAVSHAAAHEGGHDAAHGPTVGLYCTIFGCLAALTFITVFVSRVSLPTVAAVIMAFLIAISKATLVISFFMHVKYDPKVIRMMCVLPVVLTMIALMALMPDIAMHGPQAAGSPEAAARVLFDYGAESGVPGAVAANAGEAGAENAAAAAGESSDATAAPQESTDNAATQPAGGDSQSSGGTNDATTK